jgi:hypothetical protein
MTEREEERAARAIAANKRGVSTDDAAIDTVWTSYIGQARAAIMEERKAVVAYIRKVAEVNKSLALGEGDGMSDAAFVFSDIYYRMTGLADSIERGGHLPDTGA